MSEGTPRFDFYEKVVVCAPGKPVHGKMGAITGRAQNDDGTWGYAVHIYEGEAGWYLLEAELLATGEFDVRESFYDGTSIEVRVDSEGRGRITKIKRPGGAPGDSNS